MKMLRKLSAVLLFAALTLAVLAAANFLLVDDVHSYSRAMLQELYADAGKIDTLFWGRPTVTAVSTPMPWTPRWGLTALTQGRPNNCPTAATTCCGKPPRKIN